MAHKTKINGTNYEISGGKTLVGGTAYKITGGKTLVGGTAYAISFSSIITFYLTDKEEEKESGYAGTYTALSNQTWRELCSSGIIPFKCDSDGYVYTNDGYELAVDGDSCPTDGTSYAIRVS